jgi:hypothetical protein
MLPSSGLSFTHYANIQSSSHVLYKHRSGVTQLSCSLGGVQLGGVYTHLNHNY